MNEGRVESIGIAHSGGVPLVNVDEVEARPGRGLEGDRYFAGGGTYSDKAGPHRHVTLIEAEAIEAAERDYHLTIDPKLTRRNIVVRGLALNHLVGKEFTVGATRLRGIKLCEPCMHMEELSGKPGIRKALIHRGGLNCEILDGGTIRVGDRVAERS